MYIFLLFLITQTTEGFKVKNIDFHGNHTFSDKELRKVLYTACEEIYDEFQANMDKKRLVSFYRNRGFKNVKITEWNKKIVDFKHRLIRCDIYIEEGLRTYVREIRLKETNALVIKSYLVLSN